jgi:hypothetical protein
MKQSKGWRRRSSTLWNIRRTLIRRRIFCSGASLKCLGRSPSLETKNCKRGSSKRSTIGLIRGSLQSSTESRCHHTCQTRLEHPLIRILREITCLPSPQLKGHQSSNLGLWPSQGHLMARLKQLMERAFHSKLQTWTPLRPYSWLLSKLNLS